MKKIALINTPKFEYQDDENEIGIDHTYPTGLLQISSSLKENNYDVEYIDANFYHMNTRQIAEELKKLEADLVGFNSTFPNQKVVKNAIEKTKDFVDSKVILGGPAASLAPEYFLETTEVDYVIRGEGEKVILDLIRMIEREDEISNLQGVSYEDGDEIINQGFAPKIDVNNIPKVDVSSIPEKIRRETDEITMFTSRGCVNSCTFCSTPVIWGKGSKYRQYPVDRIFEELKEYEENGFEYKTVHFVDDNFTSDWDRVEKFIDKWEEEYGKRKNWRCLARVPDVAEEQKIRDIEDNGCKKLSVGVETTNTEIMEKINKNINLDEVEKFLDLTKESSIQTKGFFMLGFPGETEEDIMNTIEYACNSQFDEAVFNIVMAFPGTPLYNEVYNSDELHIPEYSHRITEKSGKSSENKLKKYSCMPAESLTDEVSIDRLYELKKKAFEEFYKN